MEFLNVVYQRLDDMSWNAWVESHPEICTIDQPDLLQAQEAMYFLICNEFWYRHKSLSSWTISTEVIKYYHI